MPDANNADYYFAFLQREGYLPERDDQGNVIFRRQGKIYIIRPDNDDDVYFQLLFPGLWHAEDEGSRRKSVEACNTATHSTKVVKMFMTDDGRTHGAVEMFAESAEGVSKVIPRCLSALDTAVATFVEEMQK